MVRFSLNTGIITDSFISESLTELSIFEYYHRISPPVKYIGDVTLRINWSIAFEKWRVTKNPLVFLAGFSMTPDSDGKYTGGERGIRTLGTLLTYTRFPG